MPLVGVADMVVLVVEGVAGLELVVAWIGSWRW